MSEAYEGSMRDNEQWIFGKDVCCGREMVMKVMVVVTFVVIDIFLG